MSKKSFFLRFVLAFSLLSLLTGSIGYAKEDIKVQINGNYVAFDVAPTMEDYRVLVPLRAVSEALGAEVYFDSVEKKIELKKENTAVTLHLNRSDVVVNGKVQTIDVPAKTVQNRTMVPLRFVSETFDLSVYYQPGLNTVMMSSKPGIDVPQGEDSQAISASIVSAINSERKAKNLEPLVPLIPLNQLAASGAVALSGDGESSIYLRTAGLGLPLAKEVNATEVTSPEQVASAWLNDKKIADILLSPDAHFIGVGAVKSTAPSSDGTNAGTASHEWSITCSLMSGQGFFTVERPNSTTDGILFLQGYSVNQQQKIEVYQLSDKNSGEYISVKNYISNVTDNQFQIEMVLPKKGFYQIFCANDSIFVEYK